MPLEIPEQIKMISIGNGCYVRHVIENNYYKNKIETNFFDWLLSSMNSVNQVFENLTTMQFSNKDFSIDHTNNINSPTYRLGFNQFSYLISIHDAKKSLPIEDSLKNVADKYNRRLLRLHQNLMRNEKLIFVRYASPTSTELEKIITVLRRINNKCHCKILIFDITIPDIDLANNDIMFVNLEEYRIPGVEHQTWLPEYDWDRIFSDVIKSKFYTEWV